MVDTRLLTTVLLISALTLLQPSKCLDVSTVSGHKIVSEVRPY